MLSEPPGYSINSDVRQMPSSRDDQAKIAGHVIYSSIHGDTPDNTRVPPPIPSGTMPLPVPETANMMTASIAVDPMVEGKMSSVRRTFCLFVLFDLILIFILWVIYTQLIGDTGYKAFEKQVYHYGFEDSLFDSVMLSAVRFVFLLLAYALYRSNHWWMVAITTSLSCGVLIAKIFMFDFEGSKSGNNPLSYCIIIISFVLAWIETWFLDFKVLPHEKKLLSRMHAAQGRSYGSTFIEHPYRQFNNDDLTSVITDDNQFYSPLDSDASDNEDDNKGPGPSGGHQRQENDYARLARHCWEVLWTYINSPETDWKKESGENEVQGIIHSKKIKGVGKVFRLTCVINKAPQELFEVLNNNPEKQGQWNSAVKENKIIQVVDRKVDIMYTIASEIAGGVITSRDFVNLRTHGIRDGIPMTASMGVNHPSKPSTKQYVRGKNGIGGFAFKPYKHGPSQIVDPDKTLLHWYLNTDIGGWFPQKLIDSNMSKVMLDFAKDLRKHLDNLKRSGAEP